MEKQQLLAQVRELIADAEMGRALELVQGFLANDARNKALYRESLQIAAQYNKVKRDEDRGVVTFENAKTSYNQVSNSLLNLLEYIENDNLNPAELTPPPSKMMEFIQTRKWQFWAGLPTLLLSIVALVVVFKPFGGKDSKQDETQADKEDCKLEFKPDFTNILVLPFYVPVGDANVEGLVVETLEDFSAEHKLKTDVKICEGLMKPKILYTYNKADTLGRSKGAQFVIWGRVEQGREANVVKTRYKFLGDKSNYEFKQVKWQGETIVDNLKTLSSIATEGEVTAEIKQVLLLVLGQAANLQNNPQAAIAALEGVQVQDSAVILLKNMMLADNYLAVNEKGKAKSAYDTLLTVHPNYWFARNNRASLRMLEGNYLGAVEDLQVALVKKPSDADILSALATAYQKSEQLIPATEYLEKLVATHPEKSKEINPKIESAKVKIKQLEKTAATEESRMSQRSNKQAVENAVDAHRKLGNDKEARQLVAKGLKEYPDNPKLIANDIDLKLRDKKPDAAKATFKTAIQRGVKKEEIIRFSVNVKKWVEEEMKD